MPMSRDAGGDERLDAVEQDRLVGDRHQLLGAGVGERPQPRALAAAENQSLHRNAAVSPPNAPKKFEKVPTPARVNEMLKRRSSNREAADRRPIVERLELERDAAALRL